MDHEKPVRTGGIRAASSTTQTKETRLRDVIDHPRHPMLREEILNVMEKEKGPTIPTRTSLSGQQNKPACLNFKKGC